MCIRFGVCSQNILLLLLLLLFLSLVLFLLFFVVFVVEVKEFVARIWWLVVAIVAIHFSCSKKLGSIHKRKGEQTTKIRTKKGIS